MILTGLSISYLGNLDLHMILIGKQQDGILTATWQLPDHVSRYTFVPDRDLIPISEKYAALHHLGQSRDSLTMYVEAQVITVEVVLF